MDVKTFMITVGLEASIDLPRPSFAPVGELVYTVSEQIVGMALVAGGILAGTPTAVGESTIVYSVQDSGETPQEEMGEIIVNVVAAEPSEAKRVAAAIPEPLLVPEEEERKPFRSIYEASEQAFQDDLDALHTIEGEAAEVEAAIAAISTRRASLLSQLDQEEADLRSQREGKRFALQAQAAKTLETLSTLQTVQSSFRSKYSAIASGPESESDGG